ncbi:TPA: hypothetical protein MHW89_27745 [Klebsiella pneumoniae]|nr:hypothetical protein AU361_20615 [Klebsiella pneumoniae]OFI07910.1 hypothetical protein BEE60_08610 [Klebsiella pneumoniae]OKO65666.1 hypothetical protein BTN83_10045 [Klebsiella pneumoniae]ONG08307.1 hypothetical protein BXT92_14090 [Klebsiella pneumoniae]OUM14893.1 hypothetical protein CBF19_23305 [Klebsiella pneumoniae]
MLNNTKVSQESLVQLLVVQVHSVVLVSLHSSMVLRLMQDYLYNRTETESLPQDKLHQLIYGSFMKCQH